LTRAAVNNSQDAQLQPLGDAYYGDETNEAYVAYKCFSIRQFITKG
jgi:hypothetical protein